MNIEVLADSGSVAQRAASIIADEAREAVAARGLFVMAVSGGHTPWLILRGLADAEIPWPAVHVVQVDERVAPAGHTVLDVENADVALSGPYQGRRRMTLTYPILNRARRVLWVVTGGEKAGMVNRLLDGDRSIPAGRIRSDRALLSADCAAATTALRWTKGGAITCV